MEQIIRTRNIVLALETSVQGGSISLLENGEEVDFWQGEGNVSKSEDILDAISKILKSNGVLKEDIKTIMVSRGPGSFTGTRIGLAIAGGLQKSLNCEVRGVSVLKAMAFLVESTNNITTAIKVGSRICVQNFYLDQNLRLREVAAPFLLEFDSFVNSLVEVSDSHKLSESSDTRIILNNQIYKTILEKLTEKNKKNQNVFMCSKNLAFLIGKSVHSSGEFYNINPIYITELR